MSRLSSSVAANRRAGHPAIGGLGINADKIHHTVRVENSSRPLAGDKIRRILQRPIGRQSFQRATHHKYGLQHSEGERHLLIESDELRGKYKALISFQEYAAPGMHIHIYVQC